MAALTRPPLLFSQKLALAWLGLVALVGALAPFLPLPYLPSTPDLVHVAQAPFGPGHHWLGTDPQGRDVLSILVFGARTALLLTVPAALFAAGLGALLGGAAGFSGNTVRLPVPYWLLLGGLGWWYWQLPVPLAGLAAAVVGAGLLVGGRRHSLPAWPLPLNTLVLGAATTLDTIPRLVLVIALAARTTLALPSLLALLTLTAWAHPARLVRAQMLRTRILPFVEAAKATGMPPLRIWLLHALPHALEPLRTALPLSLAGLLALESTLSFLGIGLPPDVASWGRLLGTVRNEPGAWWVFVFPSMALIASIVSLNKLGRPRLAAE